MTGLDSTYDPLAWGSHLPALLAAVGASTGPVLELGVGHFSTPALHALCGAMGRKLVSVESDLKWLKEFDDKYRNPETHEFTLDSYNLKRLQIHFLKLTRFGCVFIDDSPGGENRAAHFKNFIVSSDFVVVHDYHLENESHIGPLLHGINHHVTRTYQPPTLIASKLQAIPQSILCL